MTKQTISRIRRTALQLIAGGGATTALIALSSGKVRDAFVAGGALLATFLVASAQNLLEDTGAITDRRP
jgi:O-antigen ligase